MQTHSEERDGVDFKFERSPVAGGDIAETVKALEVAADEKKWKLAVRRMKQLTRACELSGSPVPPSAYLSVLQAMERNGRVERFAITPARKVVEEMVKSHVPLPVGIVNKFAQVSTQSNLDEALALLHSLSASSTPIAAETYEMAVESLTKEGSVKEALLVLRSMIVEGGETPGLQMLGEVAERAAEDGIYEGVIQALSLTKASGYSLDTIANSYSGRSLLASGVVAADATDNTALGLRLLTAAGKADVEPERGDTLTCQATRKAFEACLRVHSKAIGDAERENNWKLGVKVLELMRLRSLTPNAYTWVRVLRLCVSQKKSRRATQVLLDWSASARAGECEPPQLSSFNSVINVCELCDETSLTLVVLEELNKTHDSEGNVITFNIALKRLAKTANVLGCEGIILGMLQAGVEPTVVTYTTAVGACAQANDWRMAEEWVRRMGVRSCFANRHTYNAALSSCLDGTLEGCEAGARIASMYLEDAKGQVKAVKCGQVEDAREGKDMGRWKDRKGGTEMYSCIPDSYGKSLCRALSEQLRECWRKGDIEIDEAKQGTRTSLMSVVDFDAEASDGDFKADGVADDLTCDTYEWHHLPKRVEV